VEQMQLSNFQPSRLAETVKSLDVPQALKGTTEPKLPSSSFLAASTAS
jgi:hypothetical protein